MIGRLLLLLPAATGDQSRSTLVTAPPLCRALSPQAKVRGIHIRGMKTGLGQFPFPIPLTTIPLTSARPRSVFAVLSPNLVVAREAFSGRIAASATLNLSAGKGQGNTCQRNEDWVGTIPLSDSADLHSSDLGPAAQCLCSAIAHPRRVLRRFFTAKAAKVGAEERGGEFSLRPSREPLRPLRLIRLFGILDCAAAALRLCVASLRPASASVLRKLTGARRNHSVLPAAR